MKAIESHLFAVATIVLIWATPSPSAAESVSSDELLDGVVARATAIFNISVIFDVRTVVHPSVEPAGDESGTYALSKSGEDWILRYPGSPNFIMTRDGSTVRFYRTESETRGPYQTIHFDSPLSLENAAGQTEAFAVVRNGTLPYIQQLRFANQTRDQARIKGDVMIGDQTTTLVEWRVSARDFDDALIVIPHTLHKDLAGYLRLYVAPGLGHALPRIEYAALDGTVVRRWNSSDFQEVDDGLYFPLVTTCRTKGAADYSMTTFRVEQIENVNRPLPPEALAISVPAGTRVRDSRPGHPQSVFRIKETARLDDIVQGLNSSRSSRSSRFRKICLAVNGLLIGLLLLFWGYRRCHAS